MGVKINTLQLENVKRVKLVEMEPGQNGLTIIGGRNNQGKTSVLDAIAWALGGEKYRPSMPARDGSLTMPYLKVTLSNGITVERKGKNSALTVTDESGQKCGQALLDSFIEQLALDLPKFLESSSKEKASMMLRIVGLEEQIKELDQKERIAYNRRYEIGRIAEQKRKYADNMEQWDGVPEQPISPVELIRAQQDILAKNGENQRKRQRLNEITMEKHRIADEISRLEAQIADLTARKEERKEMYAQVAQDEDVALKTVCELVDESTAELEESLRNIESLNIKIRANLDKEKALQEADEYKSQYDELSAEIKGLREEKISLLNGADLPLEGLAVEDGELVFHNQKWDNMSASEQLRVATAIVRKLNPECGFVLLDKLEQMDSETLAEFGDWLEEQGLQAIATRVSSGDECQIIIEDGYSRLNQEKKWEVGRF